MFLFLSPDLIIYTKYIYILPRVCGTLSNTSLEYFSLDAKLHIA